MSEPNSERKQIERFTSFLISKNLRKTPERYEILRCAIECEGHFDIERLHRELDKKGYHVSRETVYNTIELLCSSGIIRKLLFDTHQARYELAELTHSHLVCTQCGEITEISLDEIDARLATMSFKSFTPAYVSTCIYGLCDNCKNKEMNNGL